MLWRSSPSLLGVLLYILSITRAHGLETFIRDEDRAPNSDTIIHHPAASLSIAGDLKDLKLKSSIAQLVRALQTPSIQAHARMQAPKPELITKQNFNIHSSQARKLIYGSEVPEPVVISSQSIRINSNKTGGKRSRAIISGGLLGDAEIIDAENVKTIEGVRVPDDEHDKHHTWRNARVIKNFLVPNDRAPNPHKKRQVVVHTDAQSYMAAAAAAQSQGATTIVDNAQQGRQVVYTNSDLTNAAAYLAQNQRYPHQSQPQQPVQPSHQYQYQLPSAARSQSGQTTAFAYAQQPGQMYVMQDEGGNTYVQYSSPVQTGQTQQHHSPQPVSQLPHSQSQFSSRSGEPATPTTSQAQQTVVSSPTTKDGNNNNSPQIQQQITQAQAAVQAIQQLQQQPPQPQNSQVQIQSAQVPEASVHSSVPHQQSAQDILAAATSGATQYIIQAPGQSRSHHLPVQHSSQVSQSGFVIKPQTYVTGPGGQTFTVPIPVPSEQAGQQPGTSQRHDWHQYQAQAHFQQTQKNPHAKNRNNFADKVMDALSTNKKAFERIDTTTAVVPALASTGIFLGLSALAAGWYLSRGNREVGIVRRTGKPAGHRFRRDVASPVNNYPQEVDQATFFQSIIQQSLEKTQQQYENQAGEPVYNNQHAQQSEPVYNREPEPERYRPNKNSRVHRPQSRDDDSYYESHKSSKTQYAQEKSGALTVASSKNFAKVFVPALILGLSVISITALIFGWYITGANREIAFLEPSSYSRKKRSLMGSTALSDGWLQKTITAIHRNPYDRMPAPTSKSLLPHPFMDRETSKTSDLEFKISNAGLTGVLAGGALIAIVALGLANSLSESSSTRQLKSGRANPNSSSFAINNPHLKHLRAPRSLTDYNDLTNTEVDDAHNPGFLSSILTSIEQTHQSIVTSLHDVGLFDSKSGCSKRLVCELLLSEDDTTLRTTEKRVITFFDMLPDSVSKSWRENFVEIVSAVQKRDCSAFSCGSSGGIASVKISPASNSR